MIWIILDKKNEKEKTYISKSIKRTVSGFKNNVASIFTAKKPWGA